MVIPTLNDSEEDLRGIAESIKELDEGIPWHVSGFFPAYRLLDLPPTSLEILNKARKIGLDAGLKYVYQGNVPEGGENTFCPSCGRLLIERAGYQILQYNIRDSRCPQCDARVDGIWHGQSNSQS